MSKAAISIKIVSTTERSDDPTCVVCGGRFATFWIEGTPYVKHFVEPRGHDPVAAEDDPTVAHEVTE